MDTMDEIRERLRQVYDPELGVNIVDLGLIYDMAFTDGKVNIEMTLTTPGCPMHDTIVGGVERALKGEFGITEVDVKVVWEPRWEPQMMSEAAKEQLGYF